MVTRALHVAVLVGLVGCSSPAAVVPDAVSVDAWVVRASLDLRGVRPSLDELRRVHEHPDQADDVVDSFLNDARFGARLADHYSELYLTRTERWPVGPEALGLYDVDQPTFVTSLGDEVPRIIARVADEDLPWTDLVLGDWTMANDTLARIWPLTLEDGTGWRVAHYTDGRPAAGVLATNSLWWRYGSTDSNANRGRAAQVSRLFLCVDYSQVTIPFDPSLNLLDDEAVRTAIRTNPSCTGCHDDLDPLAGYLYGFWYRDPNSAVEAVRYHGERELLYRDYSELEPALAGVRGFSLRDLGRQLATDPRFPDCAVEQAWRMLLRRAPTEAEADATTRVRNTFISSGLKARDLYGEVVRSAAYRSEGEGGVVRLATPELLASQVEDLTGFRLTGGGWDLLTSDAVGLRGLAGGADGVTTTTNAPSPNATMLLVQERLAEAAAGAVVVADLELPPAQRRLLTRVSVDDGPGSEAFTGQLVDLHARVFGRVVAPDGLEVAAHTELWQALFDLEGSSTTAWVGVVAAMLRDPDLLLY